MGVACDCWTWSLLNTPHPSLVPILFSSLLCYVLAFILWFKEGATFIEVFISDSAGIMGSKNLLCIIATSSHFYVAILGLRTESSAHAAGASTVLDMSLSPRGKSQLYDECKMSPAIVISTATDSDIGEVFTTVYK